MRYPSISIRDRSRLLTGGVFQAGKAVKRRGRAAAPPVRRILSLVGRPDRASSISACNTSRCNALRLSGCEGRRGSLSQGLALRSTNASSACSQAHASTRLYIHRFRLKQPSLLYRLRTCCCPAPQTSLTSLNVCSIGVAVGHRLQDLHRRRCPGRCRRTAASRPPPGPAPPGSRPPAGRHVARNVLIVLVTRSPYCTHSTCCQPRGCPARLARLIRSLP